MKSIEIKNLTFSYGKVPVLKNLNLSISQGMYGLLGKNGAGKTTLMKLIVGLLPLQQGSITVKGKKDPREIRKLVGYLPQDFDFYPNMTVKEALGYLGTLDQIPQKQLRLRVEELLTLVNLQKSEKKKIKDLSGGMKRRLGIAQCLLNNPEVIIVDEPTAGLDPEERIRFRNLLSDLSGEKTVLFSTHIPGDLESTAHQLGILNHGNLIYDGDLQTLLENYSAGTYETIVPFTRYQQFKKTHMVYEQKEIQEGVLVKFIHNGKPREEYQRIPPTLEAAYLMKIHDVEVQS